MLRRVAYKAVYSRRNVVSVSSVWLCAARARGVACLVSRTVLSVGLVYLTSLPGYEPPVLRLVMRGTRSAHDGRHSNLIRGA